MIDQLSDYWANHLEEFSKNDLVQFAHELIVQNLERRNTTDLAAELNELTH